MRHIVLTTTILGMLVGSVAPAAAQQRKPRQFDAVPGIVFACAPATAFAWTGKACEGLAAEFRKRAEAARLRFKEVLITADFRTRRRDAADGFDEDKAVRVVWNFTEAGPPQGRISAGLSSNVIYEPTKADHPNIVPGQRIPRNFYAESVLFDPGVTLDKAQPYLTSIFDSFFDVGEGKI